MIAGAWDGPLDPRGGELWTRQTDMSSDGFQFMPNTTSSVINDLKFAVSKSVRSTFIILAGINIAAGVFLGLGVLWDSYKAARRNDSAFRLRTSILRVIGAAEVFPLVLSIGIVAQGIIYLISQMKGLQGLLILGCANISQTMFPGLFIVPYIQLVFGVQTILQALRPKPFQRLPKWATPVCLLIILAGLMGTFAVTQVIRPPDFCYASLLWFLQPWRLQSFVILTAIASILLIGSLIILFRLSRNATIGAAERLAASRMVYYMLLGAILNGLIAPFFASIYLDNPLALTDIQVRLAMGGSVAATVSGYVFGVLYIMLRSSKMRSIGPWGRVDLYGLQPEESVQIWAPGANVYNTHIEQPVGPPRLFQSRASSRKSIATSKTSIYSTDGTLPELPTKFGNQGQGMAEVPASAVASPRKPHFRKESYSLFPKEREISEVKPKEILSATTYTPPSNTIASAPVAYDDLLPPPPLIVTPGDSRHRRDSSLVSSATVQFALRVSNVDGISPVPGEFPGSNRTSLSGRGSQLDPTMMVKPLSVAGSTISSRRNSTMTKNNDNDQAALPFVFQIDGLDNAQDYETEDDELVTLSPTVYKPEGSRTPTPQSQYQKPPSDGFLSKAYLHSGDSYKVETHEWI